MTRDAAIWASGDGPVMGELAEAAFLLRTGWTPNQMETAGDSLVRGMMALLNAEAEYSKTRGEGQG